MHAIGVEESTKSSVKNFSVLPNEQTTKVINPLTFRQQQVLDLLKFGLQNKEIAYRMSLKEATIKLHIGQIMKRLGVSNRTMAVITYRQIMEIVNQVMEFSGSADFRKGLKDSLLGAYRTIGKSMGSKKESKKK